MGMDCISSTTMSSPYTLPEELLRRMHKSMPRKNWQPAPVDEFIHKDNCVFWPYTEQFYAVEIEKISQAVAEEIATVAGWRAADSDLDSAWMWWVVHLRQVLGIPVLQNGHGHRKLNDGSAECLLVVWISGPGEEG